MAGERAGEEDDGKEGSNCACSEIKSFDRLRLFRFSILEVEGPAIQIVLFPSFVPLSQTLTVFFI